MVVFAECHSGAGCYSVKVMLVVAESHSDGGWGREVQCRRLGPRCTVQLVMQIAMVLLVGAEIYHAASNAASNVASNEKLWYSVSVLRAVAECLGNTRCCRVSR